MCEQSRGGGCCRTSGLASSPASLANMHLIAGCGEVLLSIFKAVLRSSGVGPFSLGCRPVAHCKFAPIMAQGSSISQPTNGPLAFLDVTTGHHHLCSFLCRSKQPGKALHVKKHIGAALHVALLGFSSKTQCLQLQAEQICRSG